MKWILLLSFSLSIILTYIFLPLLKNMLTRSKVLCINYKGEKIPNAMGIVFVFSNVMTIGTIQLIDGFKSDFHIIYLLGLVFVGLIGLLDDLIGDKTIKGLRGHIKSFFQGKLTTGGIKAFFGLFIALVVSSYISNNFLDFILNGLIIGLFTNLINLFDLRPGRAIKVFIIISAILLILKFNYNNYIILSIYGILIPYASLDLKSKVMMGDTGANILGYTLGVYYTSNFELLSRIIILILLVLFHIFAEKVSFSKVIDNNKILKYIDGIGR